MTTLSHTRNECRAQKPETCPYHGSQGQMKRAIQAGDVNAYLKAKEQQHGHGTTPRTPRYRTLLPQTKTYDLFMQNGETLLNQLDADEYRTIVEYTGPDFGIYRSYLTGRNQDGTEFAENVPEPNRSRILKIMERKCQHMDNIIAKAGTLPKPLTVFRGEKITGSKEEFLQQYQPGTITRIPHYPSTSVDPRVASEFTGRTQEMNDQSVVFVIRTKEGAMLNEAMSEKGASEREMILPRNRQYRVDKVDEGVIEISPTNKHRHTFVHLTLLE